MSALGTVTHPERTLEEIRRDSAGSYDDARADLRATGLPLFGRAS